MTRLLAALLLIVPVSLAAQNAAAPDSSAAEGRRGLVAGVTGFSGGTWQPSGVELGMIWPLGRGPATNLSLSLRAGSFVQDQAVIYGRTTGFFTALLLGARTPLVTVAEVGSEQHPSPIRFIGMVEAGAELNFNSPLPQGGSMGIAAALAGISFGSGGGRIEQGFALLLGPAVFFGTASTTHLQVSLRYQNSW